MKIMRNEGLEAKLINYIREQFKVRQGIHMSDLNYCLRKQYWRKTDPATPKEEQDTLIAWGSGVAWQQWLMQQDTPPESMVIDGIIVSIDWRSRWGAIEIKSTAGAPEPNKEMKAQGISTPEQRILNNSSWMRQMMAYCYALNEEAIAGIPSEWEFSFGLAVVHHPPGHSELRAYNMTFTAQELFENWEWFKARRDVFQQALDTGVTPGVEFSEKWEHKLCPFYLRCEAELRQGGLL